MGNLMKFTGPDNGMPPSRLALLRNRDELRGVIAGLENLRSMQEALVAQVASGAVEQEALTSAVNEDAALRRNRLQRGLAAWGLIGGGKSQDIAATIVSGQIRRMVEQKALEQTGSDISALEATRVALEGEQDGLLKAVAVEAIGAGLKAELTESS